MPDDHAISVLGTFRCRIGGVALRPALGGSQRLLALLALQDRPVMRESVAGTLWPESTAEHAYSSLRSALSRLARIDREAIVITPLDLCLAPDVRVDIRESRVLAHRLLGPTAPLDADLGLEALSALSADVLPDWYDDWVLVEAEQWRQLRLHALEALATWLTASGRFANALGAALAAVRADPLRESARGTVIRVHLAEGNQSEALREFKLYRALLLAEVGVEPTDRLRDLVSGLHGPRHA